MNTTEQPQLTNREKTWRVARYFLFVIIYAALSVTLTQISLLQSLADARQHDDMIALGVGMGMTFVLMLSILIGGMNGFSDLTGEWKAQLFGAFSFLWSIDTCRAIGFAIAAFYNTEATVTDNEAIGLLYFLLGVVILLPLEILAVRAYAKRKGIPTFPNLPQ